jgi:hypothetical protein
VGSSSAATASGKLRSLVGLDECQPAGEAWLAASAVEHYVERGY